MDTFLEISDTLPSRGCSTPRPLCKDWFETKVYVTQLYSATNAFKRHVHIRVHFYAFLWIFMFFAFSALRYTKWLDYSRKEHLIRRPGYHGDANPVPFRAWNVASSVVQPQPNKPTLKNGQDKCLIARTCRNSSRSFFFQWKSNGMKITRKKPNVDWKRDDRLHPA